MATKPTSKTKNKKKNGGKSKSRSKSKSKPEPKLKLTARTADKHILYEASVQCVEVDIDFFEKLMKKKNKRKPGTFREDFCGTAALCAEFVGRHPDNRAWGIDLDRATLDWGRRNNLALLGPEAERVTLIEDDVLNVTGLSVDVACALNFSYCVFKSRDLLRRYFRGVLDSLAPEGMFVLDAWGGTDSMDELEESREIAASTRPDGTRVPRFTYIWEQESFNIVDHHIRCRIDYKFRDGTRLKRAFTYDWRLWTLPEIQEIMTEAGFRNPEVYLEGWDDDEDEPDGKYRKRKHAENMAGWVGYVVGYR